MKTVVRKGKVTYTLSSKFQVAAFKAAGYEVISEENPEKEKKTDKSKSDE